MPTPLIPLVVVPDHVADTIALINQYQRASCETMATGIVESVRAVRHHPNHSATDFWQRVGTNGGAILDALTASINHLQAYAPDLINDTLAGAGDGLIRHADGTVTISAE
jgi:hypothetical protein